MDLHRKVAEPDCLDCSACAKRELPSDAEPEGSLLVGWRLGIASVSTFIVPVAAATIGAVCWGQSHETRFLGAMIGAAIGVALAMVIGRLLHATEDGKK